jgi:hypothetical protein
MKTLFTLLTASVAIAQPALQPNSLNAGWLWPKGVYTLVIHDGPGPKTEEIATYLAAHGKVADFFQVLCHYAGQPWADQRSAMCNQQHVTPVAQLSKLQSLHQCVGNHGQDHLNTPSLNQADTLYQIGAPALFFEEYWKQQDCPALLTFPGFQTDGQHNTWLNQDSNTNGRQEGPVWADFDGSGAVQTASGPVSVGNDQECFTKGFSQQQCIGVMLNSMAQANHGGVVNLHDFNPYAFNSLDPTDLKSAYAYDYVVGIIEGCQAANNGNPCVWLKPEAIPGVHRARSVGQFTQVSDGADDFSDRIADVLVGDLNGDALADVIVPRSDGLYCAINGGNGHLYPLQRCLGFADSSMAASKYWLVDVDGDGLPQVLWSDAKGLMSVKSDGRGGFGAAARIFSGNLSHNKIHGTIYPESIRFGRTRTGTPLPDLVAMSASGVLLATNTGGAFGPLHAVSNLAYQATPSPGWSPAGGGKHMMLVDLFGTGAMDIVISGHAGLLYAKSGANTFAAFQPLTAADGFNHWTVPQIYTSLHATRVGGSVSIAGWTPVGIDSATFKTVGGRPTVAKFQVLCSDCLATLPGWIGQRQQGNMAAPPFQGGFADLKCTGAPQAFAVWGKGLFVGEVSTLPGYR